MQNENAHKDYDEAYEQKIKEVGEVLDGADLPVVLGVTLSLFCAAVTQITEREYLVHVVQHGGQALLQSAKIADSFQKAAEGQPAAPGTLQ